MGNAMGSVWSAVSEWVPRAVRFVGRTVRSWFGTNRTNYGGGSYQPVHAINTNQHVRGSFMCHLCLNERDKGTINQRMSVSASRLYPRTSQESVPVDPALAKFLSRFFEWKPNSLELENQNGEAPSIVNEDKLVAMTPVYPTYEEYYKTVEPLLTLELWNRITRDYQEEKKRPIRCYVYTCNNKVFVVDGVKFSISVLEMDIENDKERGSRNSALGNLVIFDCKSKWGRGSGSPVQNAFAYVESAFTVVHRPPVGREIRCKRYTMLTKPVAVDEGLTDLRPVAYIRSDMRSVQALRYLPKSPLGNIILHPRIEDYRLPSASHLDDYPLVTKDPLNARQLEAVARITATVAQELPRICLIHGPPGTGKSRVIVNLITQIIHGEHRRRNYRKTQILMCAPSNTAVDEVVLRLMNMNRTLSARGKSPFRLVRAGSDEKMSESVKKVSLREQATKNVERVYVPRYDSHCYENYEKNERVKFAKICEEEERLLRVADVIACTLTSCYTDKMASIFGRSAAISVCIVDEATQSIEPDTLIPLMLGVKTLVLVGDTKQLPATVISQKAKKLGLDQSLFARISNAFEKESENPMIKLDTQYRMPDPIALFPNRHFYDGALKNAAEIRELPLHFYRVFNLDSTQSAEKFSNPNEANFVANLMYTLIARANYGDAVLPISVGVITPYNNQKTLLRKKISERISGLQDRTKIDYEVNTVDSFQGQERDIMIMSCVRSNGIGFLSDRQRLCVALTRAKHTLILCGNFKTFQKNPTWRALLKDAKDRQVYRNLQASAHPNTIMEFIIR